MATLPDHEFDNDGALILTGSAGAYVATTARKIKGYYEGLRLCGRANHTNPGASTITVDEAGTVAIRAKGNTALVGGEIIDGGFYDFIYDIANNVVQVGAAPLLPLTSSGNRWGVIPFVAADGVMEVGAFIDFHGSDGDTSDNLIRIQGADGSGLFVIPTVGADAGNLGRVAFLNNATIAAGDMLYWNGGAWARIAAGTLGQFLKQGASSVPGWATTPTVAAAQATTSGTAIDFTGLPSSVSRITINFNGVSLSGTDQLIVQIGDSGGIETSGYESSSSDTVNTSTSTIGFVIRRIDTNTHISGSMTLTKLDTNTWCESHAVARHGGGSAESGGGGKALSAGPLDRVRIGTQTGGTTATPGSDTFDLGSVNIVYD